MTTRLQIDDREQRKQLKRQKELARILKEFSKYEDQKRAELEVEAFETAVEVLQTVHHQSGQKIDWQAFAFALPPHAPSFYAKNFLNESLANFVALKEGEGIQEKLMEKWQTDEADYHLRYGKYQEDHAEWLKLRELALQILNGDSEAYGEALKVFQPFNELAELGSELTFKVHDPKKVRCTLRINGHGIIPSETKSLTAAGKLSVKTMPKGRFHEIYQDYACGCCLRIGREILALLPVDSVIATILVATVDSATGNPTDLPILSALLERKTMENLNFHELDPSDSMQNFLARGDVKVSKKTGTFCGITPLAYEDLDYEKNQKNDAETLRQRIASMRARYQKMLKPSKAFSDLNNSANE